MTTITTEAGAKRRLKQIEASAWIFTHAIGIMEVDGWFGRGDTTVGLSKCKVTQGDQYGKWEDELCLDGGAVCAGIAIDYAAQRYAAARRWNKDKTRTFVHNHLGLFQTLNGREPRKGTLFDGIASWNDHEVTDYNDMKDGFATALKKLTQEKGEILVQFPKAGRWVQTTIAG